LCTSRASHALKPGRLARCEPSQSGTEQLGDQARDLTDPSPKCPGSLSGESHQDGTAVGSAAWQIREAVGQAQGDAIVWGGVSMLQQGASFADLAGWISKTADQFATDGKIQQTDVDAINAILEKKTLTSCSRILDLQPNTPIKSHMIGLSMMGWISGGYSCDEISQVYSDTTLFQFRYQPSPEDEGVRFEVTLNGGGDDWGLYASRDEPVYFAGGYDEVFRPDVFEYSKLLTNQNLAELVIDKSSSPPFDPSLSYVMVVGSKNCQGATVSVTASGKLPVPDAGPEAGPEGGKDAASDAKKDGAARDGAAAAEDLAEMAGGSCACRSAGPRAAGVPLPALLAALALAGGLRRRAESKRATRRAASALGREGRSSPR
jgi:MYXO-CTERM domain-containing protein